MVGEDADLNEDDDNGVSCTEYTAFIASLEVTAPNIPSHDSCVSTNGDSDIPKLKEALLQNWKTILSWKSIPQRVHHDISEVIQKLQQIRSTPQHSDTKLIRQLVSSIVLVEILMFIQIVSRVSNL